MDWNSGLTFLPAVDMAATRAFYEGVIGLPLALDQGVCMIFRVNAGCFWGFCGHLAEMENPASVILTLETSQVDEVYARWAEAGVKMDGEPRLNERFSIYHFFAEEPNGYRLEVQEFRDPNWRSDL